LGIIVAIKSLEKLEDDQLVLAFQKGNNKCFEVLFDRYLVRIVRYIAVLVKNMEEAKDISQEVFVKSHKALSSYKPTGKFSSWLFTIARRAVIDFQRKKQREIVFNIKDEILVNLSDSSFDSLPSELLNTCAVDELLAGVPDAHKEILLLKFVEGMSYNEIAKITGRTSGSLRTIVHRTIHKLSASKPPSS
jgi:RNA polymerase sigma-70 factor (ECF subfamily)